MQNFDKFQTLKKRLAKIYKRDHPPQQMPFLDVISRTNGVLTKEDNRNRPHDKSGIPGGIVLLKHTIPTIIIADIHARIDYLVNVLFYKDILGYTMLEKLALDLVQIVCVGDGVHSESRAAKRWQAAFEEYKGGYNQHENIDEEIRESFGVMEMIMEVKNTFPKNFHFLKGNHENITNERGGGNFPFMKFVDEGQMMDSYVKKFYGEQILEQYYLFEKNLPIFAIGKNFLVSHAEPDMFYNSESIIEYRNNPGVVSGLTWTGNDEALEGSVEKMLNAYIDPDYLQESYYFGGHRPVEELYNERANGKYIQIHNPDKFVVCIIKKDGNINLDKDITEINFPIALKQSDSTSENKKPDSPEEEDPLRFEPPPHTM